MGFHSSIGAGGHQHRWEKNGVQIDVLIPGVSRSLAESPSYIGGLPVQSPAPTKHSTAPSP